MAATGRQRLQAASRSVVRRGVDYYGHEGRQYLAEITSLDPVTADPMGVRETLVAGDNLLICQQVAQYDLDYGLDVGDNLLVVLVEGGRWVAHAVISDNTLTVTTR